MAGHVGAAMLSGRDLETGVMFEKYTIHEISEIEKKIRQDIEKKKEDLRQMVGERYRDLIEAADTITEMKRGTEKVAASISKMQDLCQNLKQSQSSFQKVSTDNRMPPRVSEQTKLYGIAISLKLLMDIPEKIWSALDDGQYLFATRLYLLARHIHMLLQVDSQATRLTGHFPILARQWTSINHFRSTIQQNCQTRLKDISLSDNAICECLCSLILIDEISTDAVFDVFLSARTVAIQQLFHSDNMDSSVKLQLCNVAMTIITTLRQIYVIFFENKSSAENPCGLLISTLSQVMSKNQSGVILSKDDVSAPSQKYLSKSLLDFRPSLKFELQIIPTKTLKDKTKQYIDRCTKDVHDGVVTLLGFILTIKGLAVIRDELWSILKQDSCTSELATICDHVIGRRVDVWDEFMRKLFIGRIETLLHGYFETTLSLTKSQIAKVLQDLGNADDKLMQNERDMSSYIWTEGPQDLSANVAWVLLGQKQASDAGGLQLKARAFTPAVQSLCRSVDQRLKSLLEDTKCYTRLPPSVDGTSNPDSGKEEPFDRFADHKVIHESLQKACEECVEKQLEYLKQQLYALKQQLMNNRDDVGSGVIIDRILLLGRFSGALCELSSSLLVCMNTLPNDDQTSLPKPVKRVPVLKSQSKSLTENQRWKDLSEKLTSFSNEAFGVWSDHIVQTLIAQFLTSLNDKSGHSILSSCTQWDTIEIEEETEDGKLVKSNIRVPMQVSWYVQTLLNNLCLGVNRMGGHVIYGSTLATLIKKLTLEIVISYESILKNSKDSIPQNRALQLWFDLKFFTNLLIRKDDPQSSQEILKRVGQIIDQLESCVDPFDLDVFHPYLQNHLTKQISRSNVLYGLLNVNDRTGMYGSSSQSITTSSTQQEQHNILPLSTCQNRFSLLPLSMQNRTGIQPIVQPPKAKVNQPSTTLNPAPSVPVFSSAHVPSLPPRVSSSSFLEQMSTVWFSNVGGGK